jgi:hypothetical protein
VKSNGNLKSTRIVGVSLIWHWTRIECVRTSSFTVSAMGAQDSGEWARQRSHAIASHAAEAARQAAEEAARAGEMLREFVVAARGRGIAPVPLHARSYDGRHRYRTGLVGWYLRANETVAVDGDGEFYVLSVPTSLSARISGATVRPSPPKLILGEGGRDGDRISLKALIERILAA